MFSSLLINQIVIQIQSAMRQLDMDAIGTSTDNNVQQSNYNRLNYFTKKYVY